MPGIRYRREIDLTEQTAEGPIGRLLRAVCGAVAILGGLVLVALTLMTVWSVLGREVQELAIWPEAAPFSWLRVVGGEFELVELAYAGAVFCFLPYCQLVGGNVIVDVFTERSPPRVRAWLAGLGHLLYTAIAALLTWQLFLRLAEHWAAAWPETTMVLQIPVVWGFVPSVLACALLTVTCGYTAARSFAEVLRRGRPGP